MTKKELETIIEENKKYVASSGSEGKRANLIGADLYGADLREAYLYGAEHNKYTIWPEGFGPVAAGCKLVE